MREPPRPADEPELVQEEEQSRSLAAGYEEQRNELVSMMKSQAEEYRAKIKARHATEISDLEALLERTKTELEMQRAQHPSPRAKISRAGVELGALQPTNYFG